MTPLQGNEQQAQSDLWQTSRTLRASMVQMQAQSKYLRQHQGMKRYVLAKQVSICDTTQIPSTENYPQHRSIIFKGYDLCIPLRLHGVFSYFVTRKRDIEQVVDMDEPSIYAKEIYTLTPTKWNPHTDAYALNEDSMVDWEGNIKEKGQSDMKIILD